MKGQSADQVVDLPCACAGEFDGGNMITSGKQRKGRRVTTLTTNSRLHCIVGLLVVHGLCFSSSGCTGPRGRTNTVGNSEPSDGPRKTELRIRAEDILARARSRQREFPQTSREYQQARNAEESTLRYLEALRVVAERDIGYDYAQENLDGIEELVGGPEQSAQAERTGTVASATPQLEGEQSASASATVAREQEQVSANAHLERARTIQGRGRAALNALGLDEYSCTRGHCGATEGLAATAIRIGAEAEQHLLRFGRCDRHTLDDLHPDCDSQFEFAEQQLTDADVAIGQRRARRDAVVQQREERARTVAQFEAAQESCAAEPRSCEEECNGDPASFACQALAYMHATGKGARFDIGLALRLAQVGCEAGNPYGCLTAESITKTATECSTSADCAPYCDGGVEQSCAFRRLPQLFAQCHRHQRQILAWKTAASRAAQEGDLATADAVTARLQALEPEWSATLDALRRGIEVSTTDNAGERDVRAYGNLLRRMQTECSL